MNEIPETPQPIKQSWIAPQLKKLDVIETENQTGSGADGDTFGATSGV
jgi:hypothetical protein